MPGPKRAAPACRAASQLLNSVPKLTPSVVNLLQAGGTLMVSPWAVVGDFAATKDGFLAGLEPSWLWKTSLSLGGLALTGATIVLANGLAEPLLGNDGSARSRRRLAGDDRRPGSMVAPSTWRRS